ncbi:MAG: FecR domain-containing protein [Phycisphaerales bacterium]|nr:FecR domain-containing protein [Phycisphaerales bacterium]
MNEQNAHDDYLWTGEGTPPADVRELEALLAPLAFADDQPFSPPVRRLPKYAWRCAAGLVALLAVTVAWLTASPPDDWALVRTAGDVRINGAVPGGAGALRFGTDIATPTDGSATLRVGDIGSIDLTGGTSVTVQRGAHHREYRLGLREGTVRATIIAPARMFAIETPSTTAIDLGCAYALTVDERGVGVLHVQAGWVLLEREGYDVRVPAGASCALRADGPDVPFFDDADPRLIQRVSNHAAHEHTLDMTRKLDIGLRRRDLLTLFHLLSRPTLAEEDRIEVLDVMTDWAPMPAGVTRAALLEGRHEALDAYWPVVRQAWTVDDTAP